MITNQTWYRKISSFFDSSLLQALCLVGACLINVFSRVEEYGGKVTYHNRLIFTGVAIFIVLLALQILFCRHLSSTVLPFFLVTTLPLKCYDSFNEFIKMAPLAIPFIAVLLLRMFVLYRAPFTPTRVFWSWVPVAVAVTLGGLGTLAFRDYIAVAYYVVGLGIGMLFLCYLFQTQYQLDAQDPDYDMASDYERAMCFTAILATFMVFHHYYGRLAPLRESYSWFAIFKDHFSLDTGIQWRNNICTVMMITMPFLFSRAQKHFIYFPIGILSAIAMILSNSRGGILIGTLECLVCVIVFLFQTRRQYQRIVVLIALVLVTAFTVIFFDRLVPYVKDLFSRLFDTLSSENIQQETRYTLIDRAGKDFRTNPIFGTGLGYKGNVDIYNPAKGSLYFYHSAPLQIVGSLGIVGILAYLYQLYTQAKLLWTVHNRFACTVALSILFLWGMSVVNPGVFAPVPFAMAIPLSLTVAEKTKAERRAL